jgi:hypothetical protein
MENALPGKWKLNGEIGQLGLNDPLEILTTLIMKQLLHFSTAFY